MTDARTRAELLRLAATLATDPAEVEPFAPAGPAAVRALTEQASDALLAGHRSAFERVAALAERLPDALAASLAQRVLGPALAARSAAATRPEKAAQLARRLPAAFLAGVAEAIDSRHVAELLRRIEPAVARDVALELEARESWVPMGSLMAELSAEALTAATAALQDATILRTGFVVEDPARLTEVVANLSDERLRGLSAVADAAGLQAERADLVGRLGAAQRERVERLAVAAQPSASPREAS